MMGSAGMCVRPQKVQQQLMHDRGQTPQNPRGHVKVLCEREVVQYTAHCHRCLRIHL